MASRRNNYKLGIGQFKQKSISTTLIKEISRFQRHLQTKENIKWGRKAKSISFVYASSRTKELAKYMLGGKL